MTTMKILLAQLVFCLPYLAQADITTSLAVFNSPLSGQELSQLEEKYSIFLDANLSSTKAIAFAFDGEDFLRLSSEAQVSKLSVADQSNPEIPSIRHGRALIEFVDDGTTPVIAFKKGFKEASISRNLLTSFSVKGNKLVAADSNQGRKVVYKFETDIRNYRMVGMTVEGESSSSDKCESPSLFIEITTADGATSYIDYSAFDVSRPTYLPAFDYLNLATRFRPNGHVLSHFGCAPETPGSGG